MPALCRDCGAVFDEGLQTCAACGAGRVVAHPELFELPTAHIDCDAFFAAVEKRDRPELRNQPVIVGGGARGVVATACYLARRAGVGSAMPMFEAMQRCPEAVVVPPDIARYRAAARQIRACMARITSRIQAVSIDEAYLDLSACLDEGGNPAAALAELARTVEREVGVTVSIGLSFNKLLAKIAVEFDKPAGFSVIGRGEARAKIAPLPARVLPGIGPATRATLERDGIETVGDLAAVDPEALVRRYGSAGRRFARFAIGEDPRPVAPGGAPKSVSVERTLERNLHDAGALAAVLSQLAERLARRLATANLAGRTVVLKLKTGEFQLLTRSRRLDAPIHRAEDLCLATSRLLGREADGRYFRLVGLAVQDLCDIADQGELRTLFDLGEADSAQRSPEG